MVRQLDQQAPTLETERNQGSLIVFQGVTPNIGTTVVSFSNAVMLAERTEAQIGYVCLNFKSSKLHHYCGIHESQTTLDAIRADVKSRSLSPSTLYGLCHRPQGFDNLNVLYGSLLREQAEYYSIEDVDYLLKLCRDTFDLTVLEVNAYWDNAATLCALQQADLRVFVSSDRLAQFQEDFLRWHGRLAPVLNLDTERSFLYVVRHKSAKGGSTFREIGKYTGLPTVGSVRRYEEVEHMLEQGRFLELAKDYAPLREDLQSMVNVLQNMFQLKAKPAIVRRSKLRKWRPKTYRIRGGTAL